MPLTRCERDGVQLFSITNSNGVRLDCISLGATITGIQFPNGTDIVLGYKDIKDYLTNSPYIGCSVGRVANRIRDARFILDGSTHQLTANVPPHHLHGGLQGIHKVNWSVVAVGEDSVGLEHISPAGSEGYPGTLVARVLYKLTEDNEVQILYTATADVPTIVNLTSHSYFNLAGKSTIHDHMLTIRGDSYTPLDKDLIALGTVEPVAGTLFDFRTPTAIGSRIAEVGGYDINYNLLKVEQKHPKDSSLRHCASLKDLTSGHELNVYTDQPGVQLYTGNFLDGSYTGKNGLPIEKHTGVCLETQAWPNAINNPDARDQMILRPSQEYSHKTVWALSWPL